MICVGSCSTIGAANNCVADFERALENGFDGQVNVCKTMWMPGMLIFVFASLMELAARNLTLTWMPA